MSYEYLVDAIFKKKKDAEEYIEKRCAITGRNKDCYRIEKYPVDQLGGKMFSDKDVYIIFGDVPRSDGSNIYGVYIDLPAAEEALEYAELQKPWVDYHIEVFGLWG